MGGSGGQAPEDDLLRIVAWNGENVTVDVFQFLKQTSICEYVVFFDDATDDKSSEVCLSGGSKVPYGHSNRYTAQCVDGKAYFEIIAYDIAFSADEIYVPDVQCTPVIPATGEQTMRFRYEITCDLPAWCDYPYPEVVECADFIVDNGHSVFTSDNLGSPETISSYVNAVNGTIRPYSVALVPTPEAIFKQFEIPPNTEKLEVEVVLVENKNDRPEYVTVIVGDFEVEIYPGESDAILANKAYFKVTEIYEDSDTLARKFEIHINPEHYPTGTLGLGFRAETGTVGVEEVVLSMQCYTASLSPSTSPSSAPSALPSSSPSDSPTDGCPYYAELQDSSSNEMPTYDYIRVVSFDNTTVTVDLFQYMEQTSVDTFVAYFDDATDNVSSEVCLSNDGGNEFGFVDRYTALCVNGFANIDIIAYDASFDSLNVYEVPAECSNFFTNGPERIKRFSYRVPCELPVRCAYDELTECYEFINNYGTNEVLSDDMESTQVESYLGAEPGSIGGYSVAQISGTDAQMYRAILIPANTEEVRLEFTLLEETGSQPQVITIFGTGYSIDVTPGPRTGVVDTTSGVFVQVSVDSADDTPGVTVRQVLLVFSTNQFPSDVLGFGVRIDSGKLGIDNVRIEMQCYTPSASPSALPSTSPSSSPTLSPTTAAPTRCPYVVESNAVPPDSPTPNTPYEPIQVISYNESAVVFVVTQLWWNDTVCDVSTYYNPYSVDETPSVDEICVEKDDVGPGESFVHTVECVNGMATIEVFLNEPTFPEGDVPDNVHAPLCTIPQTSTTKSYTYEFPCGTMPPDCKPEEAICDYEVTRTVSGVDEWYSVIRSNGDNSTTQTYVRPEGTSSVVLEFTLEEVSNGALVVFAGNVNLNLGDFSTSEDNSLVDTFGDIPVTVSCGDVKKCSVSMQIHGDHFNPETLFFGFGFESGDFVINDVAILAYCNAPTNAPTVSPTLSPSGSPTTAAPTMCPYVVESSVIPPDSPTPHTPYEPIQVISYNESAVVYVVTQLWWNDTVCKVSTYYNPYSVDETPSVDEICVEKDDVGPGESFVHTAQCVNGMATIEVFLYEPTFPEGDVPDNVHAPMCTIPQTSTTKSYTYEFPCGTMPPDCKPEEAICDYEVTRTVSGVDEWYSVIRSTGGNSTTQTFVRPEGTSSVVLGFTLEEFSNGALVVFAGDVNLNLGDFSTSEDNSLVDTFGDIPVTVSCGDVKKCSVSMQIHGDHFNSEALFFGFGFESGDFVINDVAILAYCNAPTNAPTVSPTLSPSGSPTTAAPTMCPYVVESSVIPPDSPTPHTPYEPIQVISYNESAVVYVVTQLWWNDTVCKVSTYYNPYSVDETPSVDEICVEKDDVGPGESFVHTAQCVNGMATIEVFLYEPTFPEGNVPDDVHAPMCTIPQTSTTKSYTYEFPCGTMPPDCKPEEAICDYEVTRTVSGVDEWYSVIRSTGDNSTTQTFVRPEGTSSVVLGFTLEEFSNGALVVSAGDVNLNLGDFSTSEDNSFVDTFGDIPVTVSCGDMKKCSVSMQIHGDHFNPEALFFGFGFESGDFVINDVAILAYCNAPTNAPTVSPTLSPSGSPTTAAPTMCPYVVESSVIPPDSPTPHTPYEPIQVISYNESAVVYVVTQLWWNDTVCKVSTYYNPYSVDETPSVDEICVEKDDVGPGESFVHTAQCVNGMATIEVFLYEPTFPEGDVPDNVHAPLCTIPQTSTTKSYTYEFPCGTMPPDCKPEEAICDYEVTRTVSGVDEWYSVIRSTGGNSTTQTFVRPEATSSVVLGFTLEEFSNGALVVFAGDVNLNLGDFSTSEDNSFVDTFGDIPVTVSCGDMKKCSVSMQIHGDHFNPEALFFGFGFESGDFVINDVAILAYCNAPTNAPTVSPTLSPSGSPTTAAPTMCPYVVESSVIPPDSPTPHTPYEPIQVISYNESAVVYVVTQLWWNDTVCKVSTYYNPYSVDETPSVDEICVEKDDVGPGESFVHTAQCVNGMATIEVFLYEPTFPEGDVPDNVHAPLCTIPQTSTTKSYTYEFPCGTMPPDCKPEEAICDYEVTRTVSGVDEWYSVIRSTGGNSTTQTFVRPEGTSSVVLEFLLEEFSNGALVVFAGDVNLNLGDFSTSEDNSFVDTFGDIPVTVSCGDVKKCSVSMQIHGDHFNPETLFFGFGFESGDFVINDVAILAYCNAPTNAPTVSPTLSPSGSPTTAAPTMCPYVVESSVIPPDSPTPHTPYEPIQVISYNESAVVYVVTQLWWNDTVCKVSTYYNPYSVDETPSVDEICVEKDDVGPGESFVHTAQCVNGMATIEVFLYEPTFPEGDVPDNVHAPMCTIPQTSTTKSYTYEFPCGTMPPDCKPEEAICDYEVTRTVSGVDEWYSVIRSTGGNSTTQTFVRPEGTSSVVLEFLLEEVSNGALVVFAGDVNLNLGDFSTSEDNSFVDTFGDIPVTVSCGDVKKCSVSMQIHGDHFFDETLFLGFGFESGDFVINDVTVYAYCNAPTSAPSKRPTAGPTSSPTRYPTSAPTDAPTVAATEAATTCPYVSEGGVVPSDSPSPSGLPIEVLSYNESAVVFVVTQLWSEDHVCGLSAFYNPFSIEETTSSVSQDEVCKEEYNVGYGESFVHTVECVDNMALIEVFLYDPSFPSGVVPTVPGVCVEMPESPQTKSYTYSFPCGVMPPYCVEEEEYCDSYFTRTVSGSSEWSSSTGSDGYFTTTQTYVTPAKTSSVLVEFTIGEVSSGDLTVFAGNADLEFGDFSTTTNDSFEDTFGDIAVTVTCGSDTSCSVTMEIPSTHYNEILFLGFRFEAGDFSMSSVSVYAYCDECPYPELMESTGVTGSVPVGPVTIVSYGETSVTFIVEQTFLNDTLCGLSVEYDYLDVVRDTVFLDTCDGDSNVSPGDSKEYTAQCTDGFVDVAIYAYDPDFAEGAEVFVPSKCEDTHTSTKTQKYVFRLPCSYGSMVCAPKEEYCDDIVTKSSLWSTYLAADGTKVVSKSYFLPENTGMVNVQFSLSEVADGDLYIMAGGSDLEIGTFTMGSHDDGNSGVYGTIPVFVDCSSTTDCDVAMTVPSSYFSSSQLFVLGFRTQDGTINVDVDSVQVFAQCGGCPVVPVITSPDTTDLPEAIEIVSITSFDVTVAVRQLWDDRICYMLVNYTNNDDSDECHTFEVVPPGDLERDFTIDCGADGYARGTVYAFDDFFDTIVTDQLSGACPYVDPPMATGTRLDFAVPCPAYCPTPAAADWNTLAIDSLLFATPSTMNGKAVLNIIADQESATTVELPATANNLKIDFDMYETSAGVGELFVSVGYNLLALEEFKSSSSDARTLVLSGRDSITVTVTSSSATANHVTIDIADIASYANHGRLNVGFLMENKNIAVGSVILTASS
ncbi:hypothetical protein ACA910_022709 [Epithemia clementina (nom. ined.)]